MARDHGFALRLRTQVRARRIGPRTQRAHVEHARDSGRTARIDKEARQLDMRARKRRAPALVQDADEVDGGRHAAGVSGQRRGVVRIGLDHLDRREQQQMACTGAMARQHDDRMPGGGELRDHVSPDETAAAEHQHARTRGRHRCLTVPNWPRRRPIRAA
jgi:hypothetical protein